MLADVYGNLFGTTKAGGASDAGTVFEISKSAKGYAALPVTVVSFNGSNGGTFEGSNGASPRGSLIADGQKSIRADPHLVTFPAICIALALIGFTFLGDGLRDALDPKLKGKQ